MPSAKERLGLEAGANTSLHKVRKLLSEQNSLESLARDGESPVCQVKQTLSFIVSSRSGHEKP